MNFSYPIALSMLFEPWIPDSTIDTTALLFGIPTITYKRDDSHPGEPNMPFDLKNLTRNIKTGEKFKWRNIDWVALSDGIDDSFCCTNAHFVDVER